MQVRTASNNGTKAQPNSVQCSNTSALDGEIPIFDRDGKYRVEAPAAIKSVSTTPVLTSHESPWQNGVAERWVESLNQSSSSMLLEILVSRQQLRGTATKARRTVDTFETAIAPHFIRRWRSVWRFLLEDLGRNQAVEFRGNLNGVYH
jgi:hypothetical protein